MSWKPTQWPQVLRAWAIFGGVVGVLVLLSNAQAALIGFEPLWPATREYVRDLVLGKFAEADQKSDEHFDRLEGLLLQQNADVLDAKLKILRPTYTQLMALLAKDPANQTLINQVASTKAEIDSTQHSLDKAECNIQYRDYSYSQYGCINLND